MPTDPSEHPLRVLLVDPNANTPPYDRALAQALAAAGCQVELLTSRFLYEVLGRPDGVTLTERFFQVAGSGLAERLGLTRQPTLRRALKAAEYPLDWALTLARLAMSRPGSPSRPDIVHVQWSFHPELDLPIWRALKCLGLPVVYTVHNLLPHDTSPRDAARYGRLYRAADALVVHSQRSAEALQHEWQTPPARITVTPMGPMLEQQPAVPRDEARRRLGLALYSELVLFTGLIEPYKGLGDLIDAFAAVAARRPLARLAIAGKPNEPFGPYVRQIEALGLRDRTHLDLRFLPEPELAAYLCAADVVALPYRAVTSSAMLLSARRFGCPVVVTDAGDLGELIVDGESGLLAPPSSPDQFGAALTRLLSDATLADRLGSAGQASAFGPQGWSEAARRTVALYRRLLDRPLPGEP